MESKAYTQVYYLIQNLSNELQAKIPQKLINAIKNKMDVNYQFNINDDDLANVNLLDDTEKIMSVIYTDYLATDEEKQVVKSKEKILEMQQEQKNKEKYLVNIFKNKKGE